jgi:hypothetical protein
VKTLLLCKWQLWSLSKDSLHVTAADGVFIGLQQQMELKQGECSAMTAAAVALNSQIEELQQQIQVSYILAIYTCVDSSSSFTSFFRTCTVCAAALSSN